MVDNMLSGCLTGSHARLIVVSWTLCPAEAVAGQGERRQVLHAVGQGRLREVGSQGDGSGPTKQGGSKILYLIDSNTWSNSEYRAGS